MNKDAVYTIDTEFLVTSMPMLSVLPRCILCCTPFTFLALICVNLKQISKFHHYPSDGTGLNTGLPPV